MKDLIKCMGQQIAPAELEDILLTHEAISEVVVVGVPHHEHGEAARAFMVLSEGYSVNAALETALRKLIEGNCCHSRDLLGGPYKLCLEEVHENSTAFKYTKSVTSQCFSHLYSFVKL